MLSTAPKDDLNYKDLRGVLHKVSEFSVANFSDFEKTPCLPYRAVGWMFFKI
jgi:hypothetical protein